MLRFELSAWTISDFPAGDRMENTFLFLAVNNGEEHNTKDVVLALKVGSIYLTAVVYWDLVVLGTVSSLC